MAQEEQIPALDLAIADRSDQNQVDRPDDEIEDQNDAHTASKDELHVALSLPDEVADELHEWVEGQDWPEGFEPTPKDEYHITLLYVPEGHEEHRDDDWIREADGYWVETVGLDQFGDDAVVLRVDSPEVEQHADDLQDMAENRDLPLSRFPGGYKPHITLGYGSLPKYLHAPKLKFKSGPSTISTPREATTNISNWDVVRPDTLTVLTSILRDPAPDFPRESQTVGNSTAYWWEPNPGHAVIMAFGGSIDDRAFAEQYVKLQLEAYGYERTSFTVDSTEQKTAGWNEIMEKAKRLIMSGNVTMLRNGYNVIAGHVVGDHGEYNVEIGRDDPSSRAITTWTCECPWDQYAWQRTRQWKKYEGRPCSHVMALYWTSLSTPLDEDISPNQPQQPPLPGMPPGGHGAPAPSGQPQLAPNAPTPPGSPMPPSPMQQQGDQIIGQPTPAQAPLSQPPGSPDVLPPSPMEQLQMLQPPVPGTTPGGMPAPPGAVSVPGAKMPSPFNPIQYPGGTYSRLAAQTRKQRLELAQSVEQDMGQPDQSEILHQFDNGWSIRRPTVYGDIHREGVMMSNCWTPRFWENPENMNRYRTSFGMYTDHHDPQDPHLVDQNPDWTKPLVGVRSHPAGYFSLRDPDNLPRVSFHYDYGYPSSMQGQHNSQPKPEYLDMIHDWSGQQNQPQPRVAAAEEFQNGDIVRAATELFGVKEGRDGATDAGEYTAIPPGRRGEVLGQDPTTGFVDVIFPLDAGPMTSYHVRCFVEANEIVKVDGKTPFIGQR
jgi:2'-5' RNA ligase